MIGRRFVNKGTLLRYSLPITDYKITVHYARTDCSIELLNLYSVVPVNHGSRPIADLDPRGGN